MAPRQNNTFVKHSDTIKKSKPKPTIITPTTIKYKQQKAPPHHYHTKISEPKMPIQNKTKSTNQHAYHKQTNYYSAWIYCQARRHSGDEHFCDDNTPKNNEPFNLIEKTHKPNDPNNEPFTLVENKNNNRTKLKLTTLVSKTKPKPTTSNATPHQYYNTKSAVTTSQQHQKQNQKQNQNHNQQQQQQQQQQDNPWQRDAPIPQHKHLAISFNTSPKMTKTLLSGYSVIY